MTHRHARGRALASAMVLAAVAVACSDAGELPVGGSPSPTPTAASSSPAPEPTPAPDVDPSHLARGCAGQPDEDTVVAATGNAVPLAVWRCADRVVVTGDDDSVMAAVAAAHAARIGGALLRPVGGDVPGLSQLAPDDVVAVNVAADLGVDATAVVAAGDPTALGLDLLDRAEADRVVIAHLGDRAAVAVAAVLAAASGRPLLPVTLPLDGSVVKVLADLDHVTVVGARGTAAFDLDRLLDGLRVDEGPTHDWVTADTTDDLLAQLPARTADLRQTLEVVGPARRSAWIIPATVSDDDPAALRHLAEVAGAAASAGFDVVARDVTDLRRTTSDDPLAEALATAGDGARPRVVVSVPEGIDVVAADDVAWQVDVNVRGAEVPGGGQVLFPHRRFVALYGHPAHGSLGVFGEQSPQDAVARTLEVSEGYDADGIPTVPAFDVITTLASASATPDGDYSAPVPLETMRAIHEVARANGVYLVLDLQPGRTDFLTQAKLYEELLREPDVGLALDPEWRLRPDQVHLRQIGTVDAAEVNRVVDWLAGIVREEALPQKLLMVHQFRFSMITNRDTIRTPDELAVMIHMDGQGGLFSKYDTYDALIDPGQPWWPGWKNFYDEDRPMATPEQVLAREPTPWLVSFQ